MSLDLSIILPNYNHAHYLEERLETLLEQLPEKGEILFFDDVSPDNGYEIAEKIAQKDARLRLFRNEKNLGINGCNNRGLELARGKYIAPLAVDDIILPGCIEKYLSALKANPHIPLCGSDNGVLYENDPEHDPNHIYRYEILPGTTDTLVMTPEDVIKAMRKRDFVLSGLMVMGKREAFLEHGGYRSELISSSDWYVTRRMAFSGGMIFIPEVLAVWRQTGKNLSTVVREDRKLKRKMILNMFALLTRPGEEKMRRAFRRSTALWAWMNEYPLTFLFRPRYWDFLFSTLLKNGRRRLQKHRRSLKKLSKKMGWA